VQADDDLIAGVADAVEVAVEVPDLADRLLDAVGDLIEVQVVGADQLARQQVVLDVVLPGLPEVAAWRIDEDDRHGDGLAGLHERQHLEPLVHRAEPAGE